MDPHRSILERERELARIEDAVRRTAGGEGVVLVLRGPAGIGKTELLRAARAACVEHGVATLAATGALLDRGFAFGLVHQLFDPVLAGADTERRAQLTSGAAALAEVVLGTGGEDTPAGGKDPSHAVLHGLYWLTANLAEDGPLALVVDDAHWADRPSLRFLEFLGRRLEGLGVLVVVARRDHEPGAEEQLLEELSAGPFAHDLVPAPLSGEATGAVIADVLGEAPDAAFSAVCHEVTGGSPLLVREVGRAAAEAGLHGRESERDRVASLGAAGVAGTVRRRLALLGPAPEAVARAVAILGPGAPVGDLAQVAALPEDEVQAALDALVLAAVLTPERDFVHPVVREAVDAAVPPTRRAALHRDAAMLLAARGERPAVLARHLLLTEPAGDPWVARTLADAAAAAAAEGAPDVAAVHLRRALREPPAEDERATMLLAAGELEVAAAGPEARELLEQAMAAGLTADGEARALTGLAVTEIFANPPGSAELLQQALARAEDPELRATIEAALLDTTGFDTRLRGLRERLLEEGAASADPSPTLRANLVLDEAYRCRPADVILPHAAAALDDRRLLRLLGPEALAYNLMINGLRMAEQPERALEALEAGHAEAARLGSRLGMIFMTHAHAFWHWHFGSQASTIALVRSILDPIAEAGLRMSLSTLLAVYAEALLESDEPEQAAAALDSFGFSEVDRHSIAAPDYLAARAQVRREQGRLAEARVDLQESYDYIAGRGWRAPMKSRAGMRLAEVVAQEGDRERALALLDDAEQAARDAGTGGALGCTLRARARVVGDDDPEAAIALLEASVEAHRTAPLLLERGWALHDLGVRLRAAGKRTAAREPLREALELAQRTDGLRLARLAREELLATGARPRRDALSGPESLTPSERRVAELAAKGLSNREIAESLWVTRKTVEVHLGSTYGKLGIRSRTQLADALGAVAAA